jgi:hypothetical protein
VGERGRTDGEGGGEGRKGSAVFKFFRTVIAEEKRRRERAISGGVNVKRPVGPACLRLIRLHGSFFFLGGRCTVPIRGLSNNKLH